MIFWGGLGRQGSWRSYRNCLIPMGIWRDPVCSRPNENPGASRTRNKCDIGLKAQLESELVYGEIKSELVYGGIEAGD